MFLFLAHHCTFCSMSVSVQSQAAQNWTQDPKQPDSCRIKRNDLLLWPPGRYANTAQDVVSHTCHKGTLQTAVVLHQDFHLLFCRSVLSSAVPQPVLLCGALPSGEPHPHLWASWSAGYLHSFWLAYQSVSHHCRCGEHVRMSKVWTVSTAPLVSTELVTSSSKTVDFQLAFLKYKEHCLKIIYEQIPSL